MKRFITVFLTVAVMVSLFVLPNSAAGDSPKIIIGDVNLDGRVTSADYLLLKKYFAGNANEIIGKTMTFEQAEKVPQPTIDPSRISEMEKTEAEIACAYVSDMLDPNETRTIYSIDHQDWTKEGTANLYEIYLDTTKPYYGYLPKSYIINNLYGKKYCDYAIDYALDNSGFDWTRLCEKYIENYYATTIYKTSSTYVNGNYYSRKLSESDRLPAPAKNMLQYGFSEYEMRNIDWYKVALAVGNRILFNNNSISIASLTTEIGNVMGRDFDKNIIDRVVSEIYGTKGKLFDPKTDSILK